MNNRLYAETFLERLRSGTSLSHKKLEELPLSLSIINPDVTYEEYILYLDRMHDVVKDAENTIYPVLYPFIPDMAHRSKVYLLESDLENLGHIKKYSQKPLSGNLKENTVAFAFGIMYVLEGSTLGGRFILKNITAALNLDENNGARYFSGYGNETGSRWKKFLSAMTAYESETASGQEIISGADFAFAAISNHLKTAV